MENNIKRFQIYNLFNYMNVDLDLDKEVNIFLGENGLGKTTILNCLYYTMNGRFEKLRDITFEKIKITFSDDQEYEIKYNDIIEYSDYLSEHRFNRYSSTRIELIFTEKEIEDLKNIVIQGEYNRKDLLDYIYKVNDVLRIPVRVAERELLRFINTLDIKQNIRGNADNVKKLKKYIEDKLLDVILYFPTYRRIEEDLSKLDIDIDTDDIKTRLIHFGMKDVNIAIKKTLEEIRTLAINSFTEMTGILLTQYISTSSLSKTIEQDTIINLEKLGIVLDRVGDKINLEDREKIKEMVRNKSIYQNIYLLNLLNNLIESYEKQAKYDEKIKKFVSVCNKYLVEKHFKYDESNLKLNLYNDRSKDIINIDNLSSGEKQLISIFSRLYLENSDSCIILFDEPELSLSIEWQANLLPDIMHSGKCSKLIAVTHSPFIFENEYDELAADMGQCLKYKIK